MYFVIIYILLIVMSKVLILEPFCGGSHEQLVSLFKREFSTTLDIYSLSAKKWQWRARTAALYFSEIVPYNVDYSTLFCSSVLNLAELIALRNDLSKIKKVIYFHENQLVYPIQRETEGDFQFSYNQILSSLVADVIVFNSHFNMQSFLENIPHIFAYIPSDSKPKHVLERIALKSRVLYYPIDFPSLSVGCNSNEKLPDSELLHIVWPHRWEHDKNPELFFRVLIRLKSESFKFKISVLGENYQEKPDCFSEAEQTLNDNILNWGYLKSKVDYCNILKRAHVVVSTARHEFFGVSVLEAVYLGCWPLCPNALSYPEIYDKRCLYNTEQQLYKQLRQFCYNPSLARLKRDRLNIDFRKYCWTVLKEQYRELLGIQ
ncbi:Glycosyltransferase-like domain-containing protein [Trichinella spiralis]|uniref:tRNA-queuosine alpha-mannosyltransferase n=2 Tax=Trichinella spiralis TaxID=6334 RepID=A0ABR3KGC2_TRISP